MVLLQPEGQEVPDGAEDEQGHRRRLLEGHWQGPGSTQRFHRGSPRDEENPSFLPGQGTPRREDQVGHARVPP